MKMLNATEMIISKGINNLIDFDCMQHGLE